MDGLNKDFKIFKANYLKKITNNSDKNRVLVEP